MHIEIIGEIEGIELVAVGRAIRDLQRLRRTYRPGRWRKLKGTATIRVSAGRIRLAEVHW